MRERCWAALENYWNGTVLDSVETAIQWATHMTWKGISPTVHLLDTIYEKGIKVPLPELEERYLPFWLCSGT
ncbi:ISAzo13-like element transposase-related protein [Phormidesmis sp. 146-33]